MICCISWVTSWMLLSCGSILGMGPATFNLEVSLINVNPLDDLGRLRLTWMRNEGRVVNSSGRSGNRPGRGMKVGIVPISSGRSGKPPGCGMKVGSCPLIKIFQKICCTSW